MSQRLILAHDMSAEEFFAFETPDGKSELVRGEVRVNPPASGQHGLVQTALLGRLLAHVKSEGLATVFTNTGFELLQFPRTVRAPDIAFVTAERLAPTRITEFFVRVVPDLIVEIRSPSETRAWLREKIADYGASGVRLVWVVDPRKRIVTELRGESKRDLTSSDVLDGAGVVVGFKCPVADLFSEGT